MPGPNPFARRLGAVLGNIMAVGAMVAVVLLVLTVLGHVGRATAVAWGLA